MESLADGQLTVRTQNRRVVTSMHLFMQQTPHVHSILGKKCGRDSFLSCFSFPSRSGCDTAIRAAPQKMPSIVPKTTESSFLSPPGPSLQRCFLLLRCGRQHNPWQGNMRLHGFDGRSSAHCWSTLCFLAFEFAGHNKASHVHSSARRIN